MINFNITIIISFLFLVFKILEIKIYNQVFDVKQIVKDILFINISVICSVFIYNQFTSKKSNSLIVLTNNPEF